MNKIIKGKRYNTETAEKVAEYWNGYSVRDFHYVDEELYRKTTGEFFLHGEGGAMSKYAERDADGWRGGEGIIPITIEEAKEYIEKHSDAETYERLFGAVDDGELDRITIQINAALGKRVRDAATKTGKSITEILTQLISENL